MVNASNEMWKNKLRPPVTSSIPGGTEYVAPGVTNPTPPVTPPVTATSTNPVASSFPGFPKASVATKQNPVVDLSKPKPIDNGLGEAPTSIVNSMDDNQLKDYITWASLNPSKLTQEDKFNLMRGQQVIQERAMQQQTEKPLNSQIEAQRLALTQREQELKLQDEQLKEAKRKALEDVYANKIKQERQGGQDVMDVVQSGLSFSGFGRSTYATEKQAKIQETVNDNIKILGTQRELEQAEYEAKLQGATDLDLKGIRDQINTLETESAKITGNIIQEMNKYNLENAKTEQEKIDNILALSAMYDTTPLDPAMEEWVNSAVGGIIDDKGNIDTKLLEGIDSKTKRAILRKAAEIKATMVKKPETVTLGDELFQLGEDGQRTKVAGNKKSERKSDGIGGFWRTNPVTGAPEEWGGGGMPPNSGPQEQGPSQGRIILDETPVDTLIPNVYGGTVKLVPTVANMLNNAYLQLKQQGIELKIGDSYRSNQTQANAYASGKPGVAPPGQSWHEHGQAIDISQRAEDGMFKNGQLDPRVKQALEDAGLQQLPGEPRHRSYGEGIGVQSQSEKYSQSQKNLLSGMKDKSLGATELKLLKQQGLTANDVYDYNASQKGLELTDDQRAMYNTQINSFRANKQVQAFEEGIQNYDNIAASLDDTSGVGDMAGVFQFMKSLDPQSVVREQEFNTAAGSAGVANQLGNTFAKLSEGKILTAEQAKAFKKLAKTYIENRAKTYDRLYGDMERALTNSKIDKSYYPTRASDVLKQTQQTTAPTVTPKQSKAYDDLRNSL